MLTDVKKIERGKKRDGSKREWREQKKEEEKKSKRQKCEDEKRDVSPQIWIYDPCFYEHAIKEYIYDSTNGLLELPLRMMDGIKVIASVCLNQLWNAAAQRCDELKEESS